MQRQRWFEIHDQPWFPGFLRNEVTAALETMWATNRTYHPIAPRLRAALERSGAERVVDLCSGGGGPWPVLYDQVADGRELDVCLTDLYPNTPAMLLAMGQHERITARTVPVDATQVPSDLPGFRTIFSSFHHFDPEGARAILANAFARREGIAVFEGARRAAATLLALTGVPFLAFWNGLAARPVRGRRIVWNCVLPVVPAMLWIDGVLSCLRSYSLDDLRELTSGLEARDYGWEMGEEGGPLVPIRYLIGTPR